jgi:predicted RND superfamily exporter protein
MRRVEGFVFRFRAVILLALFALTAFMAFDAAKLRLDAGLQKTLPIGHEYVETFLKYQDTRFAGANRVLIVLENKAGDVFTPDFLEAMRSATNDVFFINGIARGTVTSIWTANTRFLEVTENGFDAGDVIPSTFKPTPENMNLVRQNALKANIVGRLISLDFRSAMIQAEVQDIDPQTHQRLDYFAIARALEREIRDKYESDKISVKIVGFAKLVGDIADGAAGVVEFFAIAFVLTVLMVYLYCRSWRLTGVTLAASLCSLIWQFGLLHIMGYGLDPLAILVPFLVFAIGVSHGVQQLNMIGAEIAAGRTKVEAARATFSFLLLPGMVALATCLAGFATLYIIPIGMIRELAITASIGVGLKIVSNLVMLPLMASYVAPSGDYARKVQSAMAGRERFWPVLARIALPRNAFLLIGFCVFLGVAGSIVSRDLQIGDVHAGAAELRPDARYNVDTRFVAEHFALGMNLMTVMVEAKEAACIDARTMGVLDRFQWEMANVDGVRTVIGLPGVAKGLATLFREGNLKWRQMPRDRRVLSQAVTPIEPQSGLLDFTCATMAINIFTTDTRAATINRVVDAVKAFRERPDNQVAGMTIRLATGNVGITAATNEVVKAAEIPMLLYVYAVVIVLVIATYREWRGALCCVLPLILSTIIGNAFMTLAGIGLKISTLPVLAIAVGIGIDYGIYEYNRIQRYMAAGRDPHAAYLQALRDVGSATMFTGFTLAVGVSTWSFSALKFQADMGLLLTFMFMVNMIGAVTLLPALIAALEMVFPRRRGARALNPGAAGAE